VDIELDTKGIDINQVREAITPKTKAISWVNYAGVAPDIEGLQSIAKEFDLLLIEDNAHGLGGTYKGKPLGSFGDFATQSFHSTKNIQCGEGGALVINNSKYIPRAEIIREKGTDRSKFIRGQVQKYQWVDQGSSYLLAEVLAAQLEGQLENFEDIQSKRIEIWNSYFENIQQEINIELFQLQQFSSASNNVAHMFFITFIENEIRERVRMRMSDSGITATAHYVPLGASLFGVKMGRSLGNAENSKNFSQKILRLPLYPMLSDEQIKQASTVLLQAVRS
jgi:dTDP-4-amino-4,6-dideoxygalactose transaminase